MKTKQLFNPAQKIILTIGLPLLILLTYLALTAENLNFTL